MSRIPDDRLTSEEDYRHIFESTSDGLVIYDIVLDSIVDANPAACEMHGYTREEFIGLNPDAFMLPESSGVFREHSHKSELGNVFEVLAIHRCQDGSTFHVEERRSVIDHHGQRCLLSVVRDISHRIQTEKVLSEQIKSQVGEQATLLAISRTLTLTLEFEPGLILDQLREIIEYTHCGFFKLENSTLFTLATRGTPQLEGSSAVRIHLNSPETLSRLCTAAWR